MRKEEFSIHVFGGRFASLILCFSLLLVLVFGSVSSSSSISFTLPNTAFASDADHSNEDSGGGDNNHGDDNQGEDTGDQDNDHSDGSHSMPPPENAPATSDTITAGGGGSDDDSEGDEGNDNDKDDPQIPKDAPATTDALTAKKIECPPGQEVALFSTSCGPAGSDNTQGSALAATLCPTSPTPTSYGSPDGLSVSNTIWESSEVEIGQRQDMQKSLLHRVQSQTTENAPADPANCPPGTNQPTAKYEPPIGVLPYKGNEVELIESYDMDRDVKHTDVKNGDNGQNIFRVFRDGTIKTISQDSPSRPGIDTVTFRQKITPGSDTPLDRLGVAQVDLASINVDDGKVVSERVPPPNFKPGTGGTFLHRVTYNDGSAIIASRNGDQELWDVYDSNNQLKSITMADPATKTTAIENKQDNSVTFHPQGANSYTVYPRAPDGTQKTVTVTSEGQPIVTVRDANGNVIPPKE